MNTSPDGYLTQQDLVHDRLRHTRARVLACVSELRNREHATEAAITAQQLERAAASRLAVTDDRARLPVTWLRERLALSPTEEAVIWLLAAHELDPAARVQLRALSTEDGSELTLDVIRRVVYGADAVATASSIELSPSGRLTQLGVIERTDRTGECATFRQTYRVARRVLALIAGHAGLDDGLAGIATIACAATAIEDVVAAADVVEAIRAALRTGSFAAVLGSTGIGRRTLICAAAREAGREVIEIDARALARDPDELVTQLRALAREWALLRAIPLVREIETLAPEGDRPDRLALLDRELLQRTEGPIFVTCGSSAPAARWSRRPVVVEMKAPTVSDRARLWRAALPEADDSDGRVLAAKYPLAPAMIIRAASAIHDRATGTKIEDDAVRAGIRSVLDDRMAGLARRIDVTQTWDDLVLAPEQLEIVVELLSRIEHRGRVHEEWGFARKVGRGLGVAALFSGPPGTGKTMVAGLIGNDLGVDVYQVDPSRVVSKWIGETEKNLAALFDAAEAGHAVLLFDEADALFAKRTEVKTSNDRNANLEVNYLLQRLESFTGVCILTSNHESAIDEAFRRRLAVHLRFEMPEAAERAKLWKAMLPEQVPIAGAIDVRGLAARFEMSGGHIRNAVLRAAFLAADEGHAISQDHLVRAGLLEYESLGRVVMGPRSQRRMSGAA